MDTAAAMWILGQKKKMQYRIGVWMSDMIQYFAYISVSGFYRWLSGLAHQMKCELVCSYESGD